MLGIIFALYVKRRMQRLALFVFAICFVAAEAGVKLHLDPLLMCLAAGLFVENVTDVEGSHLIHGIEGASMPVFAVFFSVAGASLHWDVFRQVAAFAVLLAATRALGMQVGSRIGMVVGNVPREHRSFIPYGMLSQSGVSIGLSILIAKQYTGWGVGYLISTSITSVSVVPMFSPVWVCSGIQIVSPAVKSRSLTAPSANVRRRRNGARTTSTNGRW